MSHITTLETAGENCSTESSKSTDAAHVQFTGGSRSWRLHGATPVAFASFPPLSLSFLTLHVPSFSLSLPSH